MDKLLFLAAIQGLAVLGWLAAARWLRLDVEWRVLASVALPALVTIGWMAVRYVAPAWTPAASPDDRGWAIVLTLMAIGSGLVSGVFAIPMALFLEHRHASRPA